MNDSKVLVNLKAKVETLRRYGNGPIFDDPTCYETKDGHHLDRDAVIALIDDALKELPSL